MWLTLEQLKWLQLLDVSLLLNTYGERCFPVIDIAMMHPHKAEGIEFPYKEKTHQDSSFSSFGQANKLKKPC